MRGEFGDEVLTYCLKRLTDLRKLYEEEVEGRRRLQKLMNEIKTGKTNTMSKEEFDERFLEMLEKINHQQKYGW